MDGWVSGFDSVVSQKDCECLHEFLQMLVSLFRELIWKLCHLCSSFKTHLTCVWNGLANVSWPTVCMCSYHWGYWISCDQKLGLLLQLCDWEYWSRGTGSFCGGNVRVELNYSSIILLKIAKTMCDVGGVFFNNCTVSVINHWYSLVFSIRFRKKTQCSEK